MKKALKIFWTIIVAMAILLFAAWLLIQLPGVQTFIAKKVTNSLEDRFNGRIEFSRIHLKPFNALVVKDLSLIGEDDTLASASSIVATFSLKGLLKKEGLHLGRVEVDDGSFTLVIDSLGHNITRFFGTREKDSTVRKEMGNLFDARKVRVDGFRFRMVNLKEGNLPKEYGISWSDMDVMVDELDAHDLSLAGGYMKGTVENLKATEKSGYRIESISGRTKVGHGQTLIEDLHLVDSWSDIKMDEFSMTYDNIKSFSNFIEEVRLAGDIRNSRIDFKSLSYFAPALKDMGISLNVPRADVEGPVSDLGINRFEFRETVSGVSGKAEGRISGLPDIEATVFDFNAEDLSFTADGLGKFIKGFAPYAKLDLSKYAPGEVLGFDGKVKGRLNDLSINGVLDSKASGSVKADISTKDLIKNGGSRRFSGSIKTDKLDLGKLTGIDKLGETTLRGILDASIGKGGTRIKIDTLFIDKLHALDYDYSNIVATGIYTDKAFDGRLVCNDPNLNLLFQGIFTLSDQTRNGLYKFYANVGYADLNALGLDKRGVSKVAGRVNANYMTINSGDIIGDLDILDLNLENSQGSNDIGDIRIKSHSNDNVHRINLNSSFADGSFVGSKPFTNILKDLKELIIQRELPVVCKDTTNRWKGDNYDVSLNIHDARDVLSFAMPGFYIADSTRIRLSVSGNGDVKATVKSPRIAMKKNYIRNLDLAFDNKDGSLNGAITGTELAAAGMILKNDNINFFASDNHVGLGYTYDNLTEVTDKGQVFLSGEFERGPDGVLLIHGKTLPSSIVFNDQEWTITPTSIEVSGKDINVDNLVAASIGQSLRLDGGFSTTANDTLNVELVKFNLGLANRFVGDEYGIAGHATGHAWITSPWKDNAGLMLSMVCDSVSVAGNEVGLLRLGSSLDEDGKLHLIARNELEGKTTLNIGGDYFTRNKNLDITADFDGMEVGYLSPALKSVFSEMGGKMSGKVRLTGTTDRISLAGQGTRFDNVMLRVGFTNVPYYATGDFHVSDSGVTFNDIAVKDRYDGKGTLTGGILFNHLKDIHMDTRISMDRMEAINMDEKSGQAFYGNVFATGDVKITGPFNAIQLDINARTAKNGSIHIPIDNASSQGSSNLLTFKEAYKEVYVDPYDVMMNRLVTESKKDQDFGLKLRVAANQNTEAYVEIDRTAGNVLSGRGQGTIDIVVRPGSDLFTINGDYTLNSGNFHFNAMDIAKRDFNLSNGSSVRFNGDIMDSDLDIDGIYSTKASVATLIADTSAVSARRTVNCGIGISGKLREPQLSFSIDVPDLDPTTKSKVESALNTEDKVQRQFIALLISGGFLPDEQSGVVNNSNVLYSNLAEIMAGQLNNILQKLDIPLDFGLNYQSNDSGTNIFDVAVSTQLFNNRVIVNGNVGNRDNRYSAGADVVGDLDIEIKLDKPGQVRLNLFSHSADDYTTYLDNTQRNGVGVTYQREFNTFKEFFRSLFMTRKKREEMMNRPVAPVQKIHHMDIMERTSGQ